MRELEVEVSCAKSNTVEIKVGNIDVEWGWDDLKERFVTNMRSMTRVDGLRRIYIIRDINPLGWVAACDTRK